MNTKEGSKDRYTIYDDHLGVEAEIEIHSENGAIHLVIMDPEVPPDSPCGTLGLPLGISPLDGFITNSVWTNNISRAPTDKLKFKHSINKHKPQLRKRKEATNEQKTKKASEAISSKEIER